MNTKILAAACAFSALFCVQAQTTFKTPQEAVRYYEDLVGTLAGQVRTLQDENAKLSGSIQNIQRQLEAIARNNELLTKDIVDMRKQLSTDANKREKQLSQIADKLKTAATSSKSQTNFSEYEEYVVQKGATLTAISKAYGVSLDAIKKANNMTSDVVRVGEKLKIPRK